MRWYLATIAWIIVIGGLIWTSVVHGQVLCTYRAEILNRLASEWGEELVEVEYFEFYGLLEALVSPTEGTWTLLLTRPSGISCVLATGKGLGTDKDSLEPTEYVL